MTSPSRRPASRLATALSITALVLGTGACTEDAPEADPAPTSRSEATDPVTSEPGSPSESASSESPPAEGAATVTVPAYFVGDTPQGPRLFREFRAVPEGDPLMEAARLLTAGDTLDPDYRTLWPPVDIADVQATDGLLLVRIAGDGFTQRPDGMSRRAARLAIQQLVHTLQGVQQARVPVQFQRDDTDPMLFGLDTTSPFTNAEQVSVSSLVNVTTPEQGASVTSDTLEASGVASSFEANVPWEIRRGQEVVLDGFATAEGWMGRLYPWQADIDVSGLEPGDYTFVARTDDPSGGAEGAGPHEDTKNFTLQ